MMTFVHSSTCRLHIHLPTLLVNFEGVECKIGKTKNKKVFSKKHVLKFVFRITLKIKILVYEDCLSVHV